MKKDGKATAKKEKTFKKFTVDFSSPVENSLLTLESGVKYLKENIKVNGLKGKLGDSIKINPNSSKEQKNSIIVQVDSNMKFSKRYIRYLVKKYLKKEGISRFLTVHSSAPNAYTVKVLEKNEA